MSMNKGKLTKRQKYIEHLIEKFPGLEYGVFYSLMRLKENETLPDKFSEPENFCPKCMAPRSAGYWQSHLSPYPKKARILKALRQRERLKRTSQKDRILIEALRTKKNILTIKCMICHFEVRNLLNMKQKKSDKESVSNDDTNRNIKVEEKSIRPPKKKKKKKEVNAGLIIPEGAKFPPAKVKKACKIKTNVNPVNGEPNKKPAIDVQEPANVTPDSQILDSKLIRKPSKKINSLDLSSCGVNVKQKRKSLSMPFKKLSKIKDVLAKGSALDKEGNKDLAFFLNSLV